MTKEIADYLIYAYLIIGCIIFFYYWIFGIDWRSRYASDYKASDAFLNGVLWPLTGIFLLVVIPWMLIDDKIKDKKSEE